MKTAEEIEMEINDTDRWEYDKRTLIIKKAITEAVAEEQERCAKVADGFRCPREHCCGIEISRAIRKEVEG